jgi:ABC-type Fe3+/spermidine/putrescine transport system ATPase subunit
MKHRGATRGASLLRQLDTPILNNKDCFPPLWDRWIDDYRSGVNYEQIELRYNQLSSGEQALVRIAQSLDGKGTTNLAEDMAAIDHRLREAVAAELAALIDRLPQ